MKKIAEAFNLCPVVARKYVIKGMMPDRTIIKKIIEVR